MQIGNTREKEYFLFLAALLVFVMAFALAACESEKKESVDEKQEETKKEDSKKLEGTLKVMATSENYQPLFDKFAEEVGPKAEFISMSSGEVLSKLKAEGGTPAEVSLVRRRH